MLTRGQIGHVRAVLGKPEDVHRLKEIGLHDGTSIEMLQPGSPCLVRFGGQKLCLRMDDLASVLVEPERAA
jgi:Fe2+ transport system protein FeoA